VKAADDTAPVEVVAYSADWPRRFAAEYFALKCELAAYYGPDREGYADAKGAFIQAVVQRACA